MKRFYIFIFGILMCVVTVFGSADIDRDQKLTGSDTTRLGQCVTHRQLVSDFGATDEEADAAVGLTYANDCTAMADIDGDSLITGGDTTRLGQCITHMQLVNDFGALKEEANAALGIDYDNDCQLVVVTDGMVWDVGQWDVTLWQ
jgi:hypothetical protein